MAGNVTASVVVRVLDCAIYVWIIGAKDTKLNVDPAIASTSYVAAVKVTFDGAVRPTV